MSGSLDAESHSDRIGPNAAIQLIAAMKALGETEALMRLFEESGRSEWLEAPPQEMIPTSDAARLHVGLRGLLPPARAEAALAVAGGLTADYLLANRIPRPAQVVLKVLPPKLAAWVLMRAISANAWTFAGSGVFSYSIDSGAEARISDNPLCSGLRAEAPACVWHAAVFEGLFRTLVSPSTRVHEIACRARGDACCRFRLEWAHARTSRRHPEPGLGR